jgi:hypothetical protein
VWLALGFFAVMLAATAVFALSMMRETKGLKARGEAVQTRLDELAERAEALEARVAVVTERSAEVEQHVERMKSSLERLSVLTWALGDARRGIARIRSATRK